MPCNENVYWDATICILKEDLRMFKVEGTLAVKNQRPNKVPGCLNLIAPPHRLPANEEQRNRQHA